VLFLFWPSQAKLRKKRKEKNEGLEENEGATQKNKYAKRKTEETKSAEITCRKHKQSHNSYSMLWAAES